MPTLKEIAEESVKRHLVDNPCRGIVLGLSEKGEQVQLSWTMGRSPPSQNRVYTINDVIMSAELADLEGVPEWMIPLITYNAMNSAGEVHIVTNGNQTDTVINEALRLNRAERDFEFQDFYRILKSRFCEPDPAIFTARISGYQNTRSQLMVDLSILKADDSARKHWKETETIANAAGVVKQNFGKIDDYFDEIDKRAGLNRNAFPTIREAYKRSVEPGFGYMLTTYMSGSKTLPAFEGSPILVPIKGSLEDTMQFFWGALEPQFRVSLGGRKIDAQGFVSYANPINTKVKK